MSVWEARRRPAHTPLAVWSWCHRVLRPVQWAVPVCRRVYTTTHHWTQRPSYAFLLQCSSSCLHCPRLATQLISLTYLLPYVERTNLKLSMLCCIYRKRHNSNDIPRLPGDVPVIPAAVRVAEGGRREPEAVVQRWAPKSPPLPRGRYHCFTCWSCQLVL